MTAFKFGSVLPSGEVVEHRYSSCWEVEKTTGPERLVIAPTSGYIPLLVDLMRRLPEPFGILYVLTVSRCDQEVGRYQSPYPTDREETAGFLKTYREYFERDGRHHVWVMSLPAEATLVYDNHNVIYAYGPLADFQTSLEVSGLERGDVRFPVPHHHLYNAEFDGYERSIIKHWDWVTFPLQPGDS